VSLSLGMRAFAFYDAARAAWVAEAGAFEVRVGRSSADVPLRAGVTLAADWVSPTRG
jgi:beta-glucosidase